MSFEFIKTTWISFVNRMNRLGVPVPTVRDPQSGKGSITAALVVFSAGMLGLCIVFMLAASVAKWAGFFALTDLSIAQVKTAADYSFQFLLAALGGYLGRHFQKDQSKELDPSPKKPEAALKADDPDQQ